MLVLTIQVVLGALPTKAAGEHGTALGPARRIRVASVDDAGAELRRVLQDAWADLFATLSLRLETRAAPDGLPPVLPDGVVRTIAVALPGDDALTLAHMRYSLAVEASDAAAAAAAAQADDARTDPVTPGTTRVATPDRAAEDADAVSALNTPD